MRRVSGVLPLLLAAGTVAAHGARQFRSTWTWEPVALGAAVLVTGHEAGRRGS